MLKGLYNTVIGKIKDKRDELNYVVVHTFDAKVRDYLWIDTYRHFN